MTLTPVSMAAMTLTPLVHETATRLTMKSQMMMRISWKRCQMMKTLWESMNLTGSGDDRPGHHRLALLLVLVDPAQPQEQRKIKEPVFSPTTRNVPFTPTP